MNYLTVKPQETKPEFMKRASSFFKANLPKKVWNDDEIRYAIHQTKEYFFDMALSGIASRFDINETKGIVFVIVESRSGVQFTGKAICGPYDIFNKYIGMYIALSRALGHSIPQSFLK